MSAGTRAILLVESDIIVRSPLAEYLRECGYLVLEASSTAEAREHFAGRERPIDIVLADVDVAGEGGFALAGWVRREYPGVGVVLAATIERAAEKASDLCEQGPSVSKPYDHQLVVERIRRMMAARGRS